MSQNRRSRGVQATAAGVESLEARRVNENWTHQALANRTGVAPDTVEATQNQPLRSMLAPHAHLAVSRFGLKPTASARLWWIGCSGLQPASTRSDIGNHAKVGLHGSGVAHQWLSLQSASKTLKFVPRETGSVVEQSGTERSTAT